MREHKFLFGKDYLIDDRLPVYCHGCGRKRTLEVEYHNDWYDEYTGKKVYDGEPYLAELKCSCGHYDSIRLEWVKPEDTALDGKGYFKQRERHHS